MIFNQANDARTRTVRLMLGLGFASAISHSLVEGSLTTWMATLQVDIRTIGYFSLVLLPHHLKFCWAPLLDRHTPRFMGRRRGWMLASLTGVLICAVGLGWTDPVSQPGLVALVAFGLAAASASFDISGDAHRNEILSAGQRTTGNARYLIGWRAGVLIGSSGALVLAEWLSWRHVFLLSSATIITGICCVVLSDERAVPPGAPHTFKVAVLKPLTEFFGRAGSTGVLAFIMLYHAGDILASKMLPVFYYRHLGFSLTEIGAVVNGIAAGATVIGAASAGLLMTRIGLRRALGLFGEPRRLQICST